MRKLSICLLLSTASLLAQTADIAYFRAVMLPSNEVPAVNANVNGMADMIAHVVRDSSGQIVSGTVDFLIRSNLTWNDRHRPPHTLRRSYRRRSRGDQHRTQRHRTRW